MKYKMIKEVERAMVDVVSSLHIPRVYSASKYVLDNLVVRATRPRYKGKLQARNQNFQATLVIGRPNYAQKLFIKKLKKAGEPFPVKKVQLKSVK